MPESPAREPDSQPEARCVLVCQYQSCLKNGSAAVLAAFEAQQVAGVKVHHWPDCASYPRKHLVLSS